AAGGPVEVLEVGRLERPEVLSPVEHGRQARLRRGEYQGDAVAAEERPGVDVHDVPSLVGSGTGARSSAAAEPRPSIGMVRSTCRAPPMAAAVSTSAEMRTRGRRSARLSARRSSSAATCSRYSGPAVTKAGPARTTVSRSKRL